MAGSLDRCLVDGTIYNNATGGAGVTVSQLCVNDSMASRGREARFPAELKTPAVKPMVVWSVSVRPADLSRRSAEGEAASQI